MRDVAKRSHAFGWRNNRDHPLDLILLPSISNGGSTLEADARVSRKDSGVGPIPVFGGRLIIVRSPSETGPSLTEGRRPTVQ
jgi:hypothetical protein